MILPFMKSGNTELKCIGSRYQSWGKRWLQVWSQQRETGAACVGYARFQLAPMDPPEGMAEALSQNGDASLKTYLRKDKNAMKRDEVGTKRVRKSRTETKA